MSQMRTWRCMVCGYEHEGDAPPQNCPVCGAPWTAFAPQSPKSAPMLPEVVRVRPPDHRYVIIGNSSAGRSAAAAIKRISPAARVSILSEEDIDFYYRPILPDLIGGLSAGRFFNIAKGLHADEDLEILRPETVRAIDSGARKVICASGLEVEYDSLLIASGSAPIMIPWPGSDVAGIAYFRTFADAQAISNLADGARQAVVVGGGLLGLEFVRAFLARNLPVTMLVRGNRVGEPGLDREAGSIIEARLSQSGVKVALQEEVVAFESSAGRVNGIRTNQGRVIPCDLVGIAVGVKPHIDFLEGSGVAVDRGVLVNDGFETNVSGIFAAGDAAQVFDLAHQATRVVTSWRNAAEQGEMAGFNMAGADLHSPGVVGSNFQMFEGVSFVSIGLANPVDDGLRVEKDYDPAAGKYRKLVYRGDRLIGATLVGETGPANDLEKQILGMRQPDPQQPDSVQSDWKPPNKESLDRSKGGRIVMHKMTADNIAEAFAGESQAHIKYAAFSEQARKENHPHVARLFAAASYAEQVHANAHLKVMQGIGSVSENLKEAESGEGFEVEEMYPAYIAVADSQGEAKAGKSFHRAIEAEKVHRAMYRRSLEAIEAGRDPVIEDIFVCPHCGFTMEGVAPEECPLCGAPRDSFVKF